MSMSAPTNVVDLLSSQPRQAIIANLFKFTLLSGPVLTFTDWRRPLKVAGVTYLSMPRLVRGSIRVERGVDVPEQQIEIHEANGEIIAMLARGFFNRADYEMSRIFAADKSLQWTDPLIRFCGRVNSIDEVTRTSAKLTIKSRLDDIDKDYPLDVIEPDCNAVLFDSRCGLAASAYVQTETASVGSTKLKLLSGLTAADNYFTQGVLTFTSGTMSGISYMVKSYVGDVVVPAYPFLDSPTSGTTFSITPGCDKTLATCQSKYGYDPSSGSSAAAPFFRGKPFVPDPTVTY